jgi:hypothetical protein
MADVIAELEALPAKPLTLQDFIDGLSTDEYVRFNKVLRTVKAEDVAKLLRAKGYKVSARSVTEAKARVS